MERVLLARVGRVGRGLSGHGGLEGCPGGRDASTTHLAGGVIDAPSRRSVEECELTCHAHQSTQGV